MTSVCVTQYLQEFAKCKGGRPDTMADHTIIGCNATSVLIHWDIITLQRTEMGLKQTGLSFLIACFGEIPLYMYLYSGKF